MFDIASLVYSRQPPTVLLEPIVTVARVAVPDSQSRTANNVFRPALPNRAPEFVLDCTKSSSRHLYRGRK
jgi:hypothetical protein